jgi:hypothetical protein
MENDDPRLTPTQRAVLDSPSAKVSAPNQCDILKNETYRGIADRLDTDFNFDAGDGPARSIINLLQKKGLPLPRSSMRWRTAILVLRRHWRAIRGFTFSV